MRSYVLGTALLVCLTAPALAEEFYIVQNPTTKKCTIITREADNYHDHHRRGWNDVHDPDRGAEGSEEDDGLHNR